jgi:CheY-like chemotaxis protein
LDISKIEAKKFTLSPTEFNLDHMLQRVINVMGFRIDEKYQEFKLICDEALPTNIIADDQRLSQVITNLVGNSVKFTDEGGTIILEVRLIDEDDTSVHIEFSVIDNGIGISPEQMDRIFAQFEQAENTTSRSYGGTGLGLSISRNIVEMMGGELTVSSVIGEGSKFSFTILAAKAPSTSDKKAADQTMRQATAEPEDDLFSGEGSLAGYHILLAEDVDVNREIVLALLEPTGITIDCAVNGQEAVDAFNENPKTYDLIFMDIQMPILSGLEATRVIRLLDIPEAKSIPIVAMTANVFREEVEEYLAAGMTDHIGKPLDFREVIAKLRIYLNR